MILGYFKTLLAAETYPTRSPEERDDRDKQIADELLEYLEVNLAESSVKRTKPLWDTGEPFMQYTEEQLNLMLSNERIWRFFKKVVLFDQIPAKDCDLPKTDLDKLKEAELIKEENGHLPSFSNKSVVENADFS